MSARRTVLATTAKSLKLISTGLCLQARDSTTGILFNCSSLCVEACRQQSLRQHLTCPPGIRKFASSSHPVA